MTNTTQKAKELEEAIVKIFESKLKIYSAGLFSVAVIKQLMQEAYQLGQQTHSPDIKQWVSELIGTTITQYRAEIEACILSKKGEEYNGVRIQLLEALQVRINSTTTSKTPQPDTLNQALAKRLYAIQQILNEWPGSELSRQIDAVLNPMPETIDDWYPGDLVSKKSVLDILEEMAVRTMGSDRSELKPLRECITKINKL